MAQREENPGCQMVQPEAIRKPAMRGRWKYSDLAKKTALPNQSKVQAICAEAKARKLATDREQAEKDQQEFIEFIRQHTGIELIPEYKFDPKRKWRYDFVNLELRLAIEIDGGIWMEVSGHNSGTGITNSMEKRNEAVVMGFKALHITPQQKFTPYIVDLINRLKTAA